MTDPFLPLSYGTVLELVLDLDGEELVLEWRKRKKRKMMRKRKGRRRINSNSERICETM